MDLGKPDQDGCWIILVILFICINDCSDSIWWFNNDNVIMKRYYFLKIVIKKSEFIYKNVSLDFALMIGSGNV